MTAEEIKAWLDSLPPDERKRVLDALYSSYQERGEQLDVEQGRAEELRGTPMPGMRDTGRFVTAANPLEFAATAANRGVGEYKARGIADRREAMASQKEAALQALVARMLAGRTPPPAAMATPPVSPPVAASNPAALAQMLRNTVPWT